MSKQTLVTKFFQKKNKEQESPIRHQTIQPLLFLTPPTQELDSNPAIKRKKSSNLDNWVKKRRNIQQKWPYLPKQLVYQIYKFLQLRECANCSRVCKFWLICYNDIYFSYSFFKDFETSHYNENEFATVLKRSSKTLKHIKKVRELIKGQKLGAFLEKTDLSTYLSENSQQQGSLLESFRLEPKKQHSSVFLTDKDLISICSESYISLQYIQLISCQFMTGKGFEAIAKCHNLTHINIQNNCNLKDQNIQVIVTTMNNLKSLMLIKCEGLTSQIFQILGQYCKKLDRLDIGGNSQLDFVQSYPLKNIINLGSLSLRENCINNEALLCILNNCKKLHSLNLEGCFDMNSYSLFQLQTTTIQRLNLRKILYKEEEIYYFIQNAMSLKYLLVNNNVLSTRVEKILVQRK